MRKRTNISQSASIAVVAVAACLSFAVVPALAEDAPQLMAGAETPLFASAMVLPTRSAKHIETSGYVACGIAWQGSIPAGGAQLWYTKSIPHSYVLDWTVMADTNATGPGVGLTNVVTQQADQAHTIYWLRIQNYSKIAQSFDMRLCLLN